MFRIVSRVGLEGRAFTMNAYSNTGELTLTSHAEKIGLDGNVTTDSRYYGIGTNGSVSSGSTDSLSSVITVTLDGRELDSCGDTLIFTEDGLEPVKDFAADALKSQDTEKTTGTGSTSQLLNGIRIRLPRSMSWSSKARWERRLRCSTVTPSNGI